MKTRIKCPKCGTGKLKPMRKEAKLVGPYSVRLHTCAECDKRVILSTQVVDQEIASKIMEAWDDESEGQPTK